MSPASFPFPDVHMGDNETARCLYNLFPQWIPYRPQPPRIPHSMNGDELKTKKWMMLAHKNDLFMPTRSGAAASIDWRLAALVVRSRLYPRSLRF